MKRFALLLAVTSATAAFIVVSSAIAGASAAGGQGSSTIEAGILTQLNAVRAARGLQPVVLAPGLQDAAAAHSRAMAQAGFFEHDTPSGSTFAARLRRYYSPRGFETWLVGENLLWASDVPTPTEVIDAWMRSAAHRANILTPRWREVGIATYEAASAPGRWGGHHVFLVTMDFGLRGRGAGTTATSAARA